MASPVIQFRAPEALRAAMEAAAERNGRSLSAEALASLSERYLGADREPAREPPKPRAEPRPPVAPLSAPRADRLATAQAAVAAKGAGEVKRGVSVAAACEAAGVMVWNGEKRPIYQKGSSRAQPKGGRR